MSALLIEGLSPGTLARLAKEAADKNKTVAEEVRDVIEEKFGSPRERLPMYVPSTEETAPFDPPYPSPGVRVRARLMPERVPDPGSLPPAEATQ